MWRFGVTKADIFGGTGDGGGENEGAAGIHSRLEAANPSYVRRRCFGHLPWRVADAGIKAIPHTKATEAINTYLRDGVTWTRLKSLAMQTTREGGAGLRMSVRSIEEFFGKAPVQLIPDRPECMVLFLSWLLPRSEKLAILAAKVCPYPK